MELFSQEDMSRHKQRGHIDCETKKMHYQGNKDGHHPDLGLPDPRVQGEVQAIVHQQVFNNSSIQNSLLILLIKFEIS